MWNFWSISDQLVVWVSLYRQSREAGAKSLNKSITKIKRKCLTGTYYIVMSLNPSKPILVLIFFIVRCEWVGGISSIFICHQTPCSSYFRVQSVTGQALRNDEYTLRRLSATSLADLWFITPATLFPTRKTQRELL